MANYKGRYPASSANKIGYPHDFELLDAAEAMLPKREAWADFSACSVVVDDDEQTPRVALIQDGRIQAQVFFMPADIADRDQAIRAAVLLKHSKRLMECDKADEVWGTMQVINAEAERLIGEAGYE